MRSGDISLDRDLLRDVGLAGYDWSPLADGFSNVMSANARQFDFYNSQIYPRGSSRPRWYGYPVRCLASGA